MDIKIKALLAIAPFGIAISIGTSLAQPAYDAYTQRAANVDDKKKEQEDLDTKLADKAKVQKEKGELEGQIAKLRGSVPTSPDLPILAIDLERMANESGVELISIKQPDKDAIKKAGVDDTGTEAPVGTSFTHGKQQLANQVKKTMAPAAAAGAAVTGAVADAAGAATGAKPAPKPGGKGKNAGPPPDGGLLKSLVQVRLIGSYKGLRTFVHKLETYQRVVAINDVHAAVPKGQKQNTNGALVLKSLELPEDSEAGEETQGDPDRLNINMILTSYYLP